MPVSSMACGGEAGELLGDEDALLETAVGQLQPRHDVADRVDALDAGAAALVGRDEATLHGNALLLVAEPVGGRPAPDGDQQQLGLEGLAALDGHGDTVVGALDRLEAGAGGEGDLALAEGALERLGGLLVLGRHQVGQRLDDRDLGAERAPDAGELAADDTAAEDDHRPRHRLEAQRLLGGEHAVAVDLQAGERSRVGAGREHDRLADVRRPVDLDRARPGEPAGALDDGDAAPLDEPGEALVEPAHDAVLVGVDAGHVDALEGRPDPELLRLAGRVGDLGGVQQGLGRDAAHVQAGAADLVLLDQRHAQPELGRAQGAGIAPGPCSQDHDVELVALV